MSRRSGTQSLTRFLVIRLLSVVLIMFIISFLTFSLMHLVPGDLVKNLIGNRPATPEAIAQIRAQYHLNEPFLSQYFSWLANALHGDFGTSIRLNESVSTVISARLGMTAVLTILAFVFSVATAIPLGILSAIHANRPTDKFITAAALFGLSAPSFAIGLALLMFFAYYIPIFPVYGIGSSGIDTLYHLVLPSITLAFGLAAYLIRITRASMIRELASDYATFAISRGLKQRKVYLIALRNASIPIVTSSALLLTYLVGGTILVETVFALPGLGLLMNEAVLFKDIPVVQGLTILIALVIGVVNIAVDLSYRFLDPRMRGSQ